MILKDIFQSDLVKEIEESGNLKHFAAGEVIVNMDSYIKNIPVVVSGSIKVIRTEEDGREILLYYLTPGESCIVSILAGMKNETSKIKAIVEEDAEIMEFDKAVRKYSKTFFGSDYTEEQEKRIKDELLSLKDAEGKVRSETRYVYAWTLVDKLEKKKIQ